MSVFSKTANVLRMLSDAIRTHLYFFFRDVRYGMLCRDKDDLLNRLLVAGHIIEKGITMPHRRYGFGLGVIRTVIGFCDTCIQRYGAEHDQLQLALDDLLEYRQIHLEANYELPSDVLAGIARLEAHVIRPLTLCKTFSKEEFFASDASAFPAFARSRHTSRYFDGEVSDEVIRKAVEQAQTAPSACNRQSTRVWCVAGEKKEQVIGLQNGNRGFGAGIGQMLVITSNQKCWDYNHRTSAYLDGGIFTMNLLYALHYQKVCACTLNAHLTIRQQKELRRILGMDDAEIPVCFIAIGQPQDTMMVAKSGRLSTGTILHFVK